MKTENDFATQVAVNEKAQAHAREIQDTRVGGLGGSDAAIVYKIGLNGLAALSATDSKRLAVMTELLKQDNWNGNAHTNAGHAFEDWVEQTAPWGNAAYEREKVLEKQLARNFKTFAHADFVTNAGGRDAVIECKFVQATTQATATKYHAQLQWYYIMGVKSVYLFHGTGAAEPFEVFETEMKPIERDEQTIAILLNGIQILDEALSAGWKPEVQEKVSLQDTPEIVQRAFSKMAEIKLKQAELDKEADEAKTVLLQYMQDWNFAGIVSAGDGTKHTATLNRSGVTKSLDTSKLTNDHPEIDLARYWKITQRKASITFK